MLSNVSWGQYLAGAAILLLVYYLFYILKYHGKDLKNKFSGKGRLNKSVTPKGSEENSIEELEMVVNDLRYAVFDKAGPGADKEQLLHRLQVRLSDYEGLKKPAYRVAINNSCIKQAKEICGVAISEEELNAAWDEPLR